MDLKRKKNIMKLIFRLTTSIYLDFHISDVTDISIESSDA